MKRLPLILLCLICAFSALTADAQTVIKKGNPQSRVTAALLINSTTGAAMTGLTGAGAGVAVTPTAGVAGSITITYSVNGGASTNATGTIAESPLGGGAYDYTPSATEANTTFDVKYKFAATGAYDYFATVSFNTYKVDDLGIALIPTSGAIAAGSSGVTINTALTAPAANCYKGQVLVFTSGADAGQTYLVSANTTGANSVLTVLTAPGTNPSAADTFSLVVGVGQKIVDALSALGTDNRPKVSADAHTAGATIAGMTGYVAPTNADTSGVTTLLSRLGTPTGASIAADIQTRSTYAGADTAGTTTLLSRITGPVPTLAQIFAQPMQGGLTFLQSQNLECALLYDSVRSVSGAVTTLTWYARKADTNNAGNTLPDTTKPVMVKTTTYSSAALTNILSQSVIIYPANLN